LFLTKTFRQGNNRNKKC